MADDAVGVSCYLVGALMDQTIFDWMLSAFAALIGVLLNSVWQAVKDLQASDKDIAKKIEEVEVLVAGDYMKRLEFLPAINAVFAKLEKIEDKLERKVDK